VSKPGLRQYTSSKTVPVVRGGLGISIVSTPEGVLSDRDARQRNVGGEIICEVW
jgi:small subunit ribosomal protein S8